MRGFFFSPSLDGGLELVELSSSNRRRSSAFSARSSAFSARNVSLSAHNARFSARNASFSARSRATSPRNCATSPMSASIESRIAAGRRFIPTLTHGPAPHVSPNRRARQNFTPTVAEWTHPAWELRCRADEITGSMIEN